MKGKRNNKRRADSEANLVRFFAEYEECGNCAEACRNIGLHPDSYKNWIKRVPDYQDRLDAAWRKFKQNEGPTIRRRAIDVACNGRTVIVRNRDGELVWDRYTADGQPAPPDYKGKVEFRLGTDVVFYPNLLAEMNKKVNGSEFGDRQQVDVTATHRVEDLSDDELRRIALAGRLGAAEAGTGAEVPDRLRQRGGDPGQARN